MSALLWIDTKRDQALDLGDPFSLYQTLAEMDHVAGDRGTVLFPQLFGVIEATELQDDVATDWLMRVREQARQFRSEHASTLSPAARVLLGTLIEDQP